MQARQGVPGWNYAKFPEYSSVSKNATPGSYDVGGRVRIYLLLDGVHGWAATISRIGAWFFVVFYIALDAVLGVAGGVIARGARGLPADQQALVARQLEQFAFDPIVGGGGLSLLGVLGPLGWISAAVGAAIALGRSGSPLAPAILIGVSAIFAVHSWPTGSLGLAFFLVGAGWIEFARGKTVNRDRRSRRERFPWAGRSEP